VPLPRSLALAPVKEKRIKLAAGCRCELCHGPFSSVELEIHYIRGKEGQVPDPASDLQRYILILCARCHGDLHRHGVTPPEQRGILRTRAATVRRAIRAILLYRPVPYAPPAEEDLAGKFELVSHDTGAGEPEEEWTGLSAITGKIEKEGEIQAFFILAFATKPALSM
jgi:hypothetical protein